MSFCTSSTSARGTLLTAAVVTVLFVINHLDTVLDGQATTATWVTTGITAPAAGLGARRARPCPPSCWRLR